MINRTFLVKHEDVPKIIGHLNYVIVWDPDAHKHLMFFSNHEQFWIRSTDGILTQICAAGHTRSAIADLKIVSSGIAIIDPARKTIALNEKIAQSAQYDHVARIFEKEFSGYQINIEGS